MTTEAELPPVFEPGAPHRSLSWLHNKYVPRSLTFLLGVGALYLIATNLPSIANEPSIPQPTSTTKKIEGIALVITLAPTFLLPTAGETSTALLLPTYDRTQAAVNTSIATITRGESQNLTSTVLALTATSTPIPDTTATQVAVNIARTATANRLSATITSPTPIPFK